MQFITLGTGVPFKEEKKEAVSLERVSLETR